MKVCRIAAVLLAATLALAACGSDGSSGSDSGGGVFTYSMPSDIVSLDTSESGGTTSNAIKNMIYEGLTELKRNSDTIEAVPALATDWSSDGLEWTFNLREGVTFHDGTPFNAEAVKAHFDRILGPEEPVGARDFVPYVDSVEVVDDYTVVFNSIYLDPDLPLRLAGPIGQIESPTAFEEYGVEEYKNHPVGTGPFKFNEWVPEDRVVLDRYDDYWGGTPKLSQVVMRPISEAGARLIAAQSGDIDLATSLLPEQIAELEGDPDLTVNQWPTTRHIFIGMHNLKEPFDNPLVRQAMSYAVNWDVIAESIYQGMATPAGGPVPAPELGSAQLDAFTYDPEKAKEFLAQAGHEDGFSAPITATVGSVLKDTEMVQAVQQQLAQVGIDLEIQQVEYSAYIDLVRQDTETSDLVMWIDTWSAQTAEAVLHDRYYCPSYRPDGVNLSGYCNPEVDKLIDEARNDPDPTSRIATLDEAQQIVAEEAAALWGVYIDTAYATRDNVEGAVRALDEGVWADENTTVE